MKIGKEIALEAKKKGICDQWFKIMCNFNTYGQLAKMYFRGDDWAMENDFPSLPMLRKHKAVKDFGLISDSKFTYKNMLEVAFFGDSDVKLNYNGFSVGRINIRHNSKAVITVNDNAIVFVNLLDNATVQIDCTDEAKATVYCYGNLENVIAKGNVKIVRKSWAK